MLPYRSKPDILWVAQIRSHNHTWVILRVLVDRKQVIRDRMTVPECVLFRRQEGDSSLGLSRQWQHCAVLDGAIIDAERPPGVGVLVRRPGRCAVARGMTCLSETRVAISVSGRLLPVLPFGLRTHASRI
jgi:hypothetical protein